MNGKPLIEQIAPLDTRTDGFGFRRSDCNGTGESFDKARRSGRAGQRCPDDCRATAPGKTRLERTD